MGYYINNIGTTFEEKISNLKKLHNAKITKAEWQEDLVCVVDNGMFAAAAYAYSEAEFNYFNEPCGRRKSWLKVPNAAKLAS